MDAFLPLVPTGGGDTVAGAARAMEEEWVGGPAEVGAAAPGTILCESLI